MVLRLFSAVITLVIFCSSHGLAQTLTATEIKYSKQIAWAAANIENRDVSAQFRSSFSELLKDKNQLSELQSPEGKKILQQGRNLLKVVDLKDQLEKCELENSEALGIRATIASALGRESKSYCDCEELKQTSSAVLFGKDLQKHLQTEARDNILKAAGSQLAQTQKYWDNLEKTKSVDMALDLTERELDIKTSPPRKGAELLLYTKALRERSNKTYVSTNDINSAFKEVHTELEKNKTYLKEMASTAPEKALRRLIVSNPAAVAQYVMSNPAAIDLICQTLQDIERSKRTEAIIDKTFLWGGLVIAGVLISSGVGAFVGVPLSATLTTVAAGAAIAGTATGVGDTIYSSSKTYQAYNEAQNIRSSAFAEGLSSENIQRMSASDEKAQSELISSGFSAASIIPFGAGYKIMKASARASHVDYGKIATNANKIELESTQSLSRLLQEISSDKSLRSILEKSQSRIPEEEMGQFLGYLSSLPKNEKDRVISLMKAHPEKVPQAIRESSKNGVCK